MLTRGMHLFSLMQQTAAKARISCEENGRIFKEVEEEMQDVSWTLCSQAFSGVDRHFALSLQIKTLAALFWCFMDPF